MFTSMTVRTVAQLVPSSEIWPTSMPDSVITQSPSSMPWSEPLEMVKALTQLEASQAVIRADSVWNEVFFSRYPSRDRRRTFSSAASAESRTCCWASASCRRRDSFSATSLSYW